MSGSHLYESYVEEFFEVLMVELDPSNRRNRNDEILGDVLEHIV